MKKIIYLLFSVLLLLPKVILADMSGPLVREYEVEIINPNGAILYDVDYDDEKDEYVATKTDIVVPYGYKFVIDYDEEDDEEYLSIYDGKYEGSVKRSETRALLDEYKLDKDEKLSDSYNAIIVDDVDIYKGPSYGYEKTGKAIKKGTKVKVKDILDCNEDNECYKEEFDPWMYVEYDGVKGYISSYGGKVAFNERESFGYASDDINIYNDKEEVIETIKANTYLKTTVYSLDIWNGEYYIKYNDKFVTVPNDIFLLKNDEIEFTTTKKLNIYETTSKDDNDKFIAKVIGTIPAGTKFKSSYYYSDNWEMTIRYEKGNVKGWVCVNQKEYDEGEVEEDYYDGISFEWPEEKEDDENLPEDKPVVMPSNSKKDKMQLIYICIGAGIVVALSAIVTIILLNKKKKKEEK